LPPWLDWVIPCGCRAAGKKQKNANKVYVGGGVARYALQSEKNNQGGEAPEILKTAASLNELR
jgi:hypothetical protein